MADDAPKRPRGRPRLDPTDQSIDLHVRIPTKQYDQLCGEASKQRVSLPDLVRAKLKRS